MLQEEFLELAGRNQGDLQEKLSQSTSRLREE
jgi:hypothetical protein